MAQPEHGFSLVEISLAVLIMVVLAIAITTGVLVRREQAYLEDVLIQSKKILEVAERFRTRVTGYNKSNKPIYFVWQKSDTKTFNEKNQTSFPETSHYDTAYSIEIVNSAPDEKPRKSYTKVEIVVPGTVRPLGAEPTPEGESTRLTFFNQYKWLKNRQITGPAQFDKGVWFEEETR